MFSRLFHLLLVAALVFLPVYALAGFEELLGSSPQKNNDFLPVEEAFSITGRLEGNNAYIDFKVAPAHYLYKERFKFLTTPTVQTIGQPQFPEGKSQFDPNFNKTVDIFAENISIKIPVQTSGDRPELLVTFQGCAAAGLCYPPHKVFVPLTNEYPIQEAAISAPPEQKPTGADEHYYENQLKESSLLLSILLFFLAGIGLSLTPCVLPMIPIMSSLILGQQNISTSRTMGLTLVYILSMSATFAIAGTVTGFFGASLNLQAKLQSPWLIVPFSILFIILALSMFGLFELQLPAFIRDRLGTSPKKQGNLSSAALMGTLSALVVSPCVSAPLAGSLIYISTTGDALLGCLSLFALGIGMGVPLLAIGLGGRQILPKAGTWMNSIRSFFGVLLLGVAIWMLDRVIAPQITLLLWGGLLIGCSIFLGALNFQALKGYQALRQTIALLLLTYGVCLIIGFAKGNSNPFQPLASVQQNSPATTDNTPVFQRIKTLKALTQALAQAASQKKAVMVDIYADWCISCKTMETTLFPSPQIKPLLTELTLIKFDITESTAEHTQFLTQFQLFGPPALLFFDATGVYQPQLKIMGKPSENLLQNRLILLGKI